MKVLYSDVEISLLFIVSFNVFCRDALGHKLRKQTGIGTGPDPV